MKNALIVGHKGQDGTFLWNHLKEKGYSLIGVDKDKVESEGIDYHGPNSLNILDKVQVTNFIKEITPGEIYYLAAFHGSSEQINENDVDLFENNFEVNTKGILYFLEAVKSCSPNTKIFYASSCLIFAESKDSIQNEKSSFAPNSPYGISKLNGLLICRYYRNKYSLNISTGILYNHESYLRPPSFISQKIVKAAVDIKNGVSDQLILGNIEAEVDWGFAGDYIEAMHMIVESNKPDEYIIATGELRSIKDLLKIAFDEVGLNWEIYVEQDSSIINNKRNTLVGDISKIRKDIKWEPKTTFTDMIKTMVKKI